MPNRILRDTTDSEAINQLSPQAEVLFYRLIMKADDYGVFHANPKLIKANLFPLRLDQVREADISRWITECEKAGLIALYEADSKPLLVIVNFGQRMRNMKKRFPAPPDNLRRVAASCGESPPEEKLETRNEKLETKSENSPPDFAYELKNHQLFFETVGIAWGIDYTAYKKMIDAFDLFLKAKNKRHEDLAGFKDHFFNWGAKKYTEFKTKQKTFVE
jgi:hypothetical protein